MKLNIQELKELCLDFDKETEKGDQQWGKTLYCYMMERLMVTPDVKEWEIIKE